MSRHLIACLVSLIVCGLGCGTSDAPPSATIDLAMPTDAAAGTPVTMHLTIRDPAGQPVTGYKGVVTFTSTDESGAMPAPITFTGIENGVATTSVMFMTVGRQQVFASDGSSPKATGVAAAVVHGLVYTPPGAGRVRLVANKASTVQTVQLDLVANERLEVSTLIGGAGGPSSFTAGMDLPLDTTRVTGDTTLFTAGEALIMTTGTPPVAVPPVGIARLGNDHVLYVGVSRKRVAGTVFRQIVDVPAGAVFFTIRLKMQATATAGPVFDGAQPSPLFRASVRDQFGDDFVRADDIGIGKLEVQ
jgi:hypothetical protein